MNTTRIPLDAGWADLDVTDAALEVTIRFSGRAVLGLALSADEARRLGEALTTAAETIPLALSDNDRAALDACHTVTDLLAISRRTGVPMGRLVGEVAR